MRRPRFPIAIKFMLGFALAALLPMALLAIFAFRSLSASHEGRELERRKEIVGSVRNEMGLFVDDTKNQLRSISTSFDVRKNLLPALDNPLYSQNEFIQRAEFLLRASGFDFLDFIDSNGLIRARGQDTDDFNVQSAETGLIRALRNADNQIVRITRRETVDSAPMPSMEVISPVADADGKVIGIVIGGYYLDRAFFNRLGRPGSDGAVILVDSDMNGLGSNLQSEKENGYFDFLSEQTPDKFAYPLRDENPDWNSVNYMGNAIAAESLAEWFDPSTPVLLIVTFPQDEFRTFISAISKSLYVYSILAAILALVAGLILASSISAPIRQLTSRANEFAQTGMFKPFKIRSGDEVEALVHTFNDMAEELETNTRRLIQAEKIAAWRDVARKLAHEIKNPLFPIRLNVETLQRFYGKDQKAFDETFNEATNTIIEEVDHLKRLADEFSSFARMPKPLLASGDLNKTLAKTMEMFPSDEVTTYKLELAEDLPLVMFDEEQLRMALVNLIKNGAESFDGKPGTVTVSTHNLDEENKVLIEISDNGPGLSDDAIRKIFTPYYTTKESGTGLGLAIVENIVNDHSGKIWAQSELGEGTSIFITLNAAEEA
jgi:signal transduction histidine kinase